MLLSSSQPGRPAAVRTPGLVKITPVRLVSPAPAVLERPVLPPPAPRRASPARTPPPPPRPRVSPGTDPPVVGAVEPEVARPPRPRAAPRLPAPRYPQAVSRPVERRAPAPSPPSRRPRPAAPLYQEPVSSRVEEESSPSAPSTPLPPAEAPALPPPEESPGQADGQGVVVEARPIGRVDLNTPGFMALKSAEIVARFEIAADGAVVSVTLDPGTGIPAVDAEVVAYLKTTSWAPKTVGGVAVAGQQELDFTKEAR